MAGEGEPNENLLRWILISVGGSLLPFLILAIAYRIPAGSWPSLEKVLGRGELLIAAVVLNVEAAWAFSHVNARWRATWYPFVLAACALFGLCSAVVYGVAAALEETPPERLPVPSETLEQVSSFVTVVSTIMFLEAVVLGTSE